MSTAVHPSSLAVSVNPIRLRLLETELACLSSLATEVASELDGASPERAPELARGLVHLSLKVSHLLWRFGRRITDKYAAPEAEHLLERLSLTDASPLAPGKISDFVDLLHIPPGELAAAVNADAMTVTLNGVTRSLRPVSEALSRIAGALAIEASGA